MTAKDDRGCLICVGCQRTMRQSGTRDAWECRCGMFVLGMFAHLDTITGEPVDVQASAYQQGEPWVDPPAGLRVSDKFGDVGIGWGAIEIEPARLPSPAEWGRMCADAFECSGLRYVRPAVGRTLIIESGEELQRHVVYALVPIGQEAAGVAAAVRFIANKHGNGHVWAHGYAPIGPLKKRWAGGCRGAELSGVTHVVIGSYYFHKPTKDLPS